MVVTVESSISLTADQKKFLVSKLTSIYKKDIELNVKIDPKIIGGLRLTTDTNTTDLTIAAKLNTLKLSLLAE